MIVDVKIPQLPESVSEATLTAWTKKEGEYVNRDENLIEIETDKVALELPAPQAGVLVKLIQQGGATVTSGQVIAQIDTAAAAITAHPAAATPQPATAAPIAMPSAAKLAAEQGLDLANVSGSGRGGRILKEDIPAVSATAPVATPVITPPPAMPAPVPARPVLNGERVERREPMSRLRRSVAGRLILSQQTNAILTTFNEVDMKPVMDLRAKYKDRFEKEYGVKLGFMSFFVKAVVLALKKYPVLNASIDGTDIVHHDYFDIGVAVGSPRGLVVPIIRDADKLSVAEIERQITDFGNRARDGKLLVEEMQGGTYTITNGGTFGSMMSTPIINPPQSAILGMHAIKERAVVEKGQVVVRPMMYLAQSYDHRLIDGREAVLSLVAIKEAIEDPARLWLEI